MDRLISSIQELVVFGLTIPWSNHLFPLTFTYKKGLNLSSQFSLYSYSTKYLILLLVSATFNNTWNNAAKFGAISLYCANFRIHAAQVSTCSNSLKKSLRLSDPVVPSPIRCCSIKQRTGLPSVMPQHPLGSLAFSEDSHTWSVSQRRVSLLRQPFIVQSMLVWLLYKNVCCRCRKFPLLLPTCQKHSNTESSCFLCFLFPQFVHQISVSQWQWVLLRLILCWLNCTTGAVFKCCSSIANRCLLKVMAEKGHTPQKHKQKKKAISSILDVGSLVDLFFPF